MSSSTENRWRPQSGQQQQQTRRDRNSIQGPPSQPRSRNPDPATKAGASGMPVSQAPPQHNAWSAGGGAGGGRNTRSASSAGIASPTTAASGAGSAAASAGAGPSGALETGKQTETYTPVGGFNKEEVKEFLKKRRQEALAGDTDHAAQWKPTTETAGAAKQGAPWAQKPTMMSSGSDFWVQLKKQVAAKEQGG